LLEQLLSIESNQQVEVPETISEILTTVSIQMRFVVVEQILQEVKVLERFHNGCDDVCNPIGVIAMLIVLARQSLEYSVFLFPAAGQGEITSIASHVLVVLANMQDE
jgi:hypothetical protein